MIFRDPKEKSVEQHGEQVGSGESTFRIYLRGAQTGHMNPGDAFAATSIAIAIFWSQIVWV
jgi:hypothetical protein